MGGSVHVERVGATPDDYTPTRTLTTEFRGPTLDISVQVSLEPHLRQRLRPATLRALGDVNVLGATPHPTRVDRAPGSWHRTAVRGPIFSGGIELPREGRRLQGDDRDPASPSGRL